MISSAVSRSWVRRSISSASTRSSGNAEQFRARCVEVKSRLGLLAQEICRLTALVLTEWQAVTKKLPAFKAHAAAVADIEAQLKRLLGKNFVVDTPSMTQVAVGADIVAPLHRLDFGTNDRGGWEVRLTDPEGEVLCFAKGRVDPIIAISQQQ